MTGSPPARSLSSASRPQARRIPLCFTNRLVDTTGPDRAPHRVAEASWDTATDRALGSQAAASCTLFFLRAAARPRSGLRRPGKQFDGVFAFTDATATQHKPKLTITVAPIIPPHVHLDYGTSRTTSVSSPESMS
ncbi:hypothetical protein [Nonomuraea sp. NPDC049625]|uniref:hypothetical protein n=1 Tax=Nonomuraea sp. NPDC049625 TaxID=3155775 RepID=UPI003414CEC0